MDPTTLHRGLAVATAGALALVACSSSSTEAGFGPVPGPDAAAGDGGGGTGDDSGVVGQFGDGGRRSGAGPGCNTTLSGTVYDPAAKNPLYNIAVFVPGAAVSPIPSGAVCLSCSDLYTGKPVASALTDASGKFTMNGVPAGKDVPLVLQIGKWRKQLTIPKVVACQDNPLLDKSLTLPSSHTAGDIPNIAVATGNADSLECLLLRVGVDGSEYEPGAAGPGRIHIFTTNPGASSGPGPNTSPPGPDATQALWASEAQLQPYDMVLLSCEGTDQGVGANQSALFDYANAGGRVFASHFHYVWFDSGPFASQDLGSWTPGSNSIGNVNAAIVTTLWSGQPFPKGAAMQQWLGNVGALAGGLLPVVNAKSNLKVSPSNAATQPWIASAATQPQYVSVDTPAGQPTANQCGRVVYSDIHVGGATSDYGGDIGKGVTPEGCLDVALSPQEKALEFMLFDLGSCITPGDAPPAPPPVAQ
jgi:hypothetical protein